MGFVNLQTSFAPLFLLKWLSKAEDDGVRRPHELPLRPLFLLKWLSKAEGDGVRQFANILCAAFPIERD